MEGFINKAMSRYLNPVALRTDLEGIDPDDRARREEKLVQNIIRTAQMHLVVASLIMTLTFTAGFTLPGGVESDTNSPNKGTAILLRKAAFRAFVISDTIAFTFSSGAVFAYFAMAENANSAMTENEGSAARNLKNIMSNYNLAIAYQSYAMIAVVVAFATGMYVTLEKSIGLAVTVCVLSFYSFLSSLLIFVFRNQPADRAS